MLPPLTQQVLGLFAVRAASLGLGLAAAALSARLLQPENFGMYSVYIALIMVMAIPSTVGLKQAIARSVATASTAQGNAQLAHLWPAAVRIMLVTGVIGTCAWITGALFFGTNDTSSWIVLIAVALMFAIPLPYIASSALHGSGFVAAAQALELGLRPLLMLCLLCFIWLWFDPASVSVTTVMCAYLIAVALQGAIGLRLMQTRTGVGFQFKRVAHSIDNQRHFYRSCLTFGILAGVTLVNNSLDLLMLNQLAGSEAAGHYRVATTLAGLVSLGMVAISAILLPRVVSLHEAGDRSAMQRLVSQAALLGSLFAILLAAILALLSGPIISLIFGETYAPSAAPLSILILGHVASALCGPIVVVLNMTGHERVTLIGVSVGTFLNVLLNFALIPRLGMVGAAIASVASFVIWNVLLCIQLRRTTGIISLAGRWA